MKTVAVIIASIAVAIAASIVLLDRFYQPPGKGPLVKSTEYTGPFIVRINKYLETGGIIQAMNGAYFEFQSEPTVSHQPVNIMTFRHDDPIDIPNDSVHFVSDKVGFVFMGWNYAVTSDGGSNWTVYDARNFLRDNQRCGYNCIQEISISPDGSGSLTINLIASPRQTVTLDSNDFGSHWEAR